MLLIAKWKCPICGYENSIAIDDHESRSQVRFCDSDNGGCDNRVVVDVTVKVFATAKMIKED